MIDALAQDQPHVAGDFRASGRHQVNGGDRVIGTHNLRLGVHHLLREPADHLPVTNPPISHTDLAAQPECSRESRYQGGPSFGTQATATEKLTRLRARPWS